MYVITSFGAELGSRKVSPPYCMLRAFADVSTEFSVGTENSVFFYLISICTPSLPRILNLSLLISHCFPI